jgi:hypothetical protein
MDHHYIEGHNIPDRYLQGTLSAAERARFEEHMIDCPECLDRLETTEDFRRSLRTVAAEYAATSRVDARPGRRPRWIGITGWRQGLLAAAMLVLVALPSALLIVQSARSRRLVDDARVSAADWQRRYEESEQAARNAERAMLAERQARATAEGTPQALLHAAPVYDLNIVRSGGGSAVATRISIPAAARWFVLKLDMEPDPAHRSYRATLFTSDERVIGRAADLMAMNGALAITCDAAQFQPGDYRLALEGLTRQGRYVTAGVYAFHVVK